MAEAYADLLKVYSLSTIDTALRKITVRGDVFVPSAPQIVSICEGIENSRRKPEFFRALPPPAQDAAMRDRVKSGFASLVEELTSGPNFIKRAQGHPK